MVSEVNRERMVRMRDKLESVLEPVRLEIIDDSHLHAGHAGAASGRGHFTVRIRADAFAGKNRVQVHRLIYAALGEMMQTDIHALAIDAGPSKPADPASAKDAEGPQP